jgi:hypothetical protein
MISGRVTLYSISIILIGWLNNGTPETDRQCQLMGACEEDNNEREPRGPQIRRTFGNFLSFSQLLDLTLSFSILTSALILHHVHRLELGGSTRPNAGSGVVSGIVPPPRPHSHTPRTTNILPHAPQHLQLCEQGLPVLLGAVSLQNHSRKTVHDGHEVSEAYPVEIQGQGERRSPDQELRAAAILSAQWEGYYSTSTTHNIAKDIYRGLPSYG